MPLSDRKITPEKISQKGVVAAPDILDGTPQENKLLFDRLVRELVADAVNDTVDAVSAMQLCEPYSAERDYVPHNRVVWDGNTYECLESCRGIQPTSARYWLLVAARGTDGNGAGDMRADMYDPTGQNRDIFTYAMPRLEGVVEGALLCAEADGTAGSCGKSVTQLVYRDELFKPFPVRGDEPPAPGDTVYYDRGGVNKLPIKPLAGIKNSMMSLFPTEEEETLYLTFSGGNVNTVPAKSGVIKVVIEGEKINIAGDFAEFPAEMAAKRLEEGKYLLHSQDSYTLRARIATVDGSHVSLGTEVTQAMQYAAYHLFVMSPTYALAIYRSSSTYYNVLPLEIHGNGITKGTEKTFSATTLSAGAALDETHLVFQYATDQFMLCLLSGANMQLFTFTKSFPVATHALRLDSSLAVFLNTSGNAITAMLNGTALSLGTATKFSDGTSPVSCTAAQISDRKFIVAYSASSSPTRLYFRIGTVGESGITFGRETSMPCTASKKFLFVMPGSGKVFVLLCAASTNVWTYFVTRLLGDSVETPLYGGAVKNVQDGQVHVIEGGYLDCFSGLAPGATYYRQDDGTMSTAPTKLAIGKAISDTTLLFRPEELS